MNQEKEEKNYQNHIEKGWSLARYATEEILKLDGHLATNVKLIIFEKCLSPFYYFTTDKLKTKEEKPTEKQIKLAIRLGLTQPGQFSKNELRKQISELLKK